MARTSSPPASLVYLAPHGWDTIAQRAQHLTSALAAGWRVLYVEPVAPSIAGNLRRMRGGEPSGPLRERLVQRQTSLWTYTPPPLWPFTLDSGLLNRAAHRVVAPRVRRVLQRLDLVRPVLVVAWPPAAAWRGHFEESMLVYDCMDDFRAFPQSERRRRLVARWEAAAARHAALVTATSEHLVSRWSRCHGNVRLLANGVTDAFIESAADACVPADLAAIPRPRLLYVGAVSPWLDHALLLELARRHPAWSLVFVGPVHAMPRPLEELPNVHLLGTRPHDALPGYVAGADACLIPFTVSPLTIAVNPVKLYEYFAAGKPVVSVRLPEVERFADVCYVAAGRADFAHLVERALGEAEDDPRRSARREIARDNTWARRARTFAALVGAVEHTDAGRGW